ncbi:uncharacterized protein N7511_002272 [Penicillium nucicola]|uniref:uncharacterized protein n=1 Tax=Penicillium nucicola TaxID=1850975 RepID=UPI0025452418|nr:uncharacterized protein N7511_002272 [Penicillium nucicola]KAJ5770221.1 hypothetical protein N7511_002272 [Penicillium nucicola]
MWSLLSTCGTLLLASSAIATNTWSYSTYKTGDWQPTKLELNKTGDVAPGQIFISVRTADNDASTRPTIYDNDGNVVYIGPAETTMDFKVQKLFGQDVITFWSGDAGVSGGYGYGKVHILDNTYNEIYTVTLQGDFVTPTGESPDSYVDVHEHIITDRNTMIVTAVNMTEQDLTSAGGSGTQWMIDSQFYEIDIATNQVVFSWSALDYQDKIPLSNSLHAVQAVVAQDTPWDVYHVNAVMATNDGYLISMRFFSSAFYLNKDGSVRWQLSGTGTGDFTGDDLQFSWQHDIRVHNETEDSLILSIFNNANTLTEVDSETTGMAYNVDLRNQKASLMYNVSNPSDPLYAKTQGSFQFLGSPESSNIFMDYGSTPNIQEYDSNGNVVMSGQFGAYGQVETYRGLKYEWTSTTPTWNPAVAIDTTAANMTDVYMSWNGATEYDNWVVYSVPSLQSTEKTKLVSKKRTGFETMARLGSVSAKYIKVAARKGDTILGTSDAVAV